MTSAQQSQCARSVIANGGEALIVTIAPEGLYLREKHSRKSFLLPWGVAYVRAVDIAVRADIAAKPTRRVKRGLL